MRQACAPLWEALLKHKKSGMAQLHVPGHRSGEAVSDDFLHVVGKDIFQIDLTEIPGLDDLHNPQGAIEIAQQLAAELYQADKSFFMVNGTSGGLLALILACCGQGDKIIVPRNAHRSVLSGLIVSGAVPIYYQPAVIKEFGCLAGPDHWQIKSLLEKNSDVRAVVGVNPTYYGVAGDLAALAESCHGVGVPLLVDEAHGTHLKFHPELPPDALSCGADAVVQSTHKTGGSLTQSSLLHIQGQRIDIERVAEALRMIQSTSPSYVLMASLDLARQQLAVRGRELLDKSFALAHWCRESLAEIDGVKVLEHKHLGAEGAKYLDVTRLTISLLERGVTGYQLAELLGEKYQVVVEMADYASVVAVISLGTTPNDCQRLITAIKEIVKLETGQPLGFSETLNIPPPVVRLSPREAWLRSGKAVPLEQSLGHISGETVAVYPPGIPVLCPGEEITQPVLDYLTEVKHRGLQLQGPRDGSLSSLRVLA